ncbi:RNA polymerase sigma factor SigM [Planotetraspora kaengkrachanensis]|uniref:RNA polymerase sigma factor SigM n=1 Tax=Planotetraspora kaengkrachanensis TaxID=575193 RepID=A0A8J3V7P8_9ACTN|nr:RNA polymerase sigma factor SigM [Planotetraspora kaengkrachanensis]GIG81119.1 RNA polymerase sigma factor SigM [Planotetraspora kaengkrachanensis]
MTYSEDPPLAEPTTRPAATDAELLSSHLNGDPDAFREIVERHRERLWVVALRTLGDPDEAADAVQDAFVSAYRKAESFRGEAAVTTWLRRIVVNACLDRMRRKPVRPLAEAELIEAADREVSLADQTDEHEIAMEIEAALKRLPTDQRAALVLVDMMGYSVEDAATVLDVPAGTVKSRCSRGRAKLVPMLSHLRGRPGLGRGPKVARAC